MRCCCIRMFLLNLCLIPLHGDKEHTQMYTRTKKTQTIAKTGQFFNQGLCAVASDAIEMSLLLILPNK